MKINYAEEIRDNLVAWFRTPPCAGFVGVLVFQRRKPIKSGYNRRGIAAESYERDRFLREGSAMTLPFTSQPGRAWAKAPCVGFAATLGESMDLMGVMDETDG
jgi:hypothetical protein